MGGMAPRGGWLVPLCVLFGKGNMCVAEQDWSVGPMIIIKVGGVRLVAAHVVRGNHALVLAYPLLTVHGNKFKVIFIKCDNWAVRWAGNIKSAAATLLGFVLGRLTKSCPLLFVGSLVVLQSQLLLQLSCQIDENLLNFISVFSRTLHVS